MIICCGEALIDMLPRQLSAGEDVFLPAPGGAMLNTAVALGRLGEDTAFVAGISNDIFGEQLLEHMVASHVASDLCIRSNNPTTLAFVTLSNGQAQFTFFDENTAGRNLDIGTLPALPKNAAALHFGGISLISEPCGTAYEALMKQHHETCVISFDPNIRTSFIQNETVYRDRLVRMLDMSDIIKISDEDFAWLRPQEAVENVAAEWLDKGASIVVLTRGEKGASGITKRFSVSVPAQPATVVDTVGAGDAFNAGLLSALRSENLLTKAGLRDIGREDLRKILEFAAKISALTVAKAGANPPWRDEVT